MQLPHELRDAIADETSQVDSRDLSAAAARLTERYQRGDFSSALSTPADRAAYLAVRTPATYAAAARVFSAIHERLPKTQFGSLLDLGAGPGTAMWAAATSFHFESVTCIERNHAFIDIGRRLSTHAPVPAVRSARWLPGDLAQLRDLPAHQVVSFFFVLGELPDMQQETFLRAAWLKTTSLLAIVEPGTPEGFRRVHTARSLLLESGAHVVAPCPHHQTCPMFAAGDWCHFAARLERTAEHRRLKAGSLGYEDEKFSYLVASKHPLTLPYSRVLRHPLIRPGHMRLTLCRPERTEVKTVTKSHKALWRYARKLEWGDSWQPPDDSEPADDPPQARRHNRSRTAMNYTQPVTFPAWMANAPAAELAALSLNEAAQRLRTRQVSSVELTQACLDRIAALDGTLRAFITVMPETALAQARAADSEIARGNYRGPLHGIPIALKDLIDVAGVRTTAASRVFADRIATKNAPVVDQLLQAGAVIVGKTNLHEFAYGGSGMIGAFGVTRNPHDPAHITGGSSSGSAAAVAAGMCFAAIGTDTAGSIRLPAAFCGLVGFKPTHGAVNAEGVIPLAETYDHVGPIARTVADALAVFDVIAPGAVEGGISNPRFAVAREYFFNDLDEDVRAVTERCLESLRAPFRPLQEVELPVEEDRTAQMHESYRYHAPYVAANPELYDPQTLKRILRGRDITADEYTTALNNTLKLRRDVRGVFESVDAIITPTVPIPPPTITELEHDPNTLRAREILMLRNTRPFNVLGLPTITVPCGVTSSGLPVGLQITTAAGQDAICLGLAWELSCQIAPC